MRLLIIVSILLVNLSIGPCFAGEQKEDAALAKVDMKAIADQKFFSSLKEGVIVGYFDEYWQAVERPVANGYYRKLITILGNDRFVVQDFFVASHKKQSDPATITNKYELKQYGMLRSLVGVYTTWYENGQKQYSLNYLKPDELDGSVQGWYENGQIRINGLYKQGKKVGNWIEWYENGAIKSKSFYDKNKLNGPYEQWYENGKKSVQGNYLNGLISEQWITWNSDGDKLSEGYYKDNKRTGLWTYYINGKKWAEGHYKEGKQNGTWLYWDEDSTKDREIYYQEGKQISNIAY